MWSDLRNAIRALRAAPGFTSTALIVLALGIGASTAIFSVVDAVVLRGLPFDDAHRLVSVSETNKARAGVAGGSSAPQNFLEWRGQHEVFEAIGASADIGGFTIRGDGPPEDLPALQTTANLFSILRVRPDIGQPYSAANEVNGSHRVMLISDGLWRRRFNADPNVVGKTMTFESGTWQVVGVMPAGFRYPIGPARATDLWVPYVVAERDKVRGQNRSYFLDVVARLKPGVTVEQARARMEQITAGLATAHPTWFKDRGIATVTLHDYIVGARVKSWMLMLLGAVGFVLLIACVNVANLMLVRASARGRDVSIRAALGASRWQLARGLLVESFILSGAGTLIGVVIAYWAVGVLRASLPATLPRLSLVAIDVRVLAIAAIVSVVTALLFGIVPALQASRPTLSTTLREGGRAGTASLLRQQLRSLLVAAEVALAVVLLVGAGLFVASFARLMSVQIGLDYRNVVTLPIWPRNTGKDAESRKLIIEQNSTRVAELMTRVQALPGVESASLFSGGLPLSGRLTRTDVKVPARQKEFTGDDAVDVRLVTPQYMHVIRQPLVKGRVFNDADVLDPGASILLNQAAERLYFEGTDALGQEIDIWDKRRVVGVVADIRLEGPEKDARPQAFIPMARRQFGQGADLVLRTTADPRSVIPSLRSAVQQAFPDIVVPEARTFEEMLNTLIAQRKFNMLLLSLFGVLGVVIAAVGIYGVMAFVVDQRTTEFGIRMALGAPRGGIAGMVLRGAALYVGTGLVVGMGIAMGLSMIVKSFLFNVAPTDPLVYIGIAVLLITVALVAALVPALRASRVDPIVALRSS
jgi:putative ABC transport system permease protein